LIWPYPDNFFYDCGKHCKFSELICCNLFDFIVDKNINIFTLNKKGHIIFLILITKIYLQHFLKDVLKKPGDATFNMTQFAYKSRRIIINIIVE